VARLAEPLMTDGGTLITMSRSPGHRLVDIAEVGRVVAFLAGPASSGMTGDIIYIDAGLHNMA
jgi:enoyl-[acyl-carrier protein] reductase I